MRAEKEADAFAAYFLAPQRPSDQALRGLGESMAKFLLRRLANYVILVAVATSGAFILAGLAIRYAAPLRARLIPPDTLGMGN